MPAVYWISDGAGDGVGNVHQAFIRWIRANDPGALVIIGGDVYDDGTPQEFEAFFEQMDRDLTGVCETAGNHDWNTRSESASTGEIPSGYEAFWARFPPPQSRQPIDSSKRGGARYDHFIDIDGWRLICVDTGPCKHSPWPSGDPTRVTWLRNTLSATAGRAKMVCAHHSRLSRGKHGDVRNVDALWRTLFDAQGHPLAALTLAGHDHNVSMYGPRPMENPQRNSVDISNGIHVMVNGAGGRGHDAGFVGTRPDLFADEDSYCITRITLIDPTSATIETLGFGGGKNPRLDRPPDILFVLTIRL